MAFFRSLDIVGLLIMSNKRARYGIMASPSSFRIWPETLSGPTDLFSSIDANLVIILVLMAKGPYGLAH
jgi:hypothetical protein